MSDFITKVFEKQISEMMDGEEFKDLRDYQKSEENIKNCEPFKELCKKYKALQERYKSALKELNKDIEEKAQSKEYAKGGECIHRGFYSPSAQDLVTGGNNRGKLLKRPPRGNNYDYEYLFDNNNNMICARKYSDELGSFQVIQTELFIYEQDKVLSFVFAPFNKGKRHILEEISECHYKNGKLVRYERAIRFNKEKCDVEVETYEYQYNLLRSFCLYTYCYDFGINSVEGYRYNLTIDEQGYYSGYTNKQILGFNKDPDDYESEQYKALGRRVAAEWRKYNENWNRV